MRKVILMFVFLGILSVNTKISAQEDFNPALDYVYTSATFNAFLRFDINDQLTSIYFTTGDKWLEYEVLEVNYMGEGKGWTYKIKDGMGNKYTITRKTFDGNITISPIKGKALVLTRKIINQEGN